MFTFAGSTDPLAFGRRLRLPATVKLAKCALWFDQYEQSQI